MDRPQMLHQLINRLKPRRRLIPLRTAEDTPQRTQRILCSRHTRAPTLDMRLGQEGPAKPHTRARVDEHSLVEAAVVSATAVHKGHGKGAAVAAPFLGEPVVAARLGVDSEPA